MKRNFINVLIILTLCVVGFGFYRGWFALSSPSPATGSHQVNVKLTVDPDKMKSDAELVERKTTESTGKATK